MLWLLNLWEDTRESDLSIGWAHLMEEVAFYLGYGRKKTVAEGLTSAQVSEVQRYVDSGLRRFLQPPPLQPDKRSHRWAFMYPETDITIWPTTSFAAGVMTCSGKVIEVAISWKATIYFYDTMIGATITSDPAVGSDVDYTIERVLDPSYVSVDADCSASDLDAFSVAATGVYRLPADTASIYGDIRFQADDGRYSPLVQRSVSQVRRLLQHSTSAGRPQVYALSPVMPDGSVGQRYDLLVYPIPDAIYPLYFRRAIRTSKLSASNRYPPGGMEHAETVLAHCLAAAEEATRGKGEKWGYAMECLRASIDLDRANHGPQQLGYNADMSDTAPDAMHARTHVVSYEGVTYP